MCKGAIDGDEWRGAIEAGEWSAIEAGGEWRAIREVQAMEERSGKAPTLKEIRFWSLEKITRLIAHYEYFKKFDPKMNDSLAA